MTAFHKRLGLLFILVGPTGAGKNTLMNGVLDNNLNLQQLPTATSRAIRPNEEEGREHHFVTELEFREMIANNELLEWQLVHGRLYGVPRGTVEHLIQNNLDRIADIDVYGALTVRAFYPDNVVLIFVQPGADDDVVGTVRERLEQRGEPEDEIEKRLRRVEMEMRYAPYCDYLIINEDVETATQTLESIIVAERSRRHLANLKVRQDFPRHPLTHMVTMLAHFNGQVLLKDRALPATTICEDELPQEAVLRTMADLTLTRLSLPDFQQPTHISLQSHKYHEALTFWFSTAVSPEAVPAEGWEWQDLDTLKVPQEVKDVIEATPMHTEEKPS